MSVALAETSVARDITPVTAEERRLGALDVGVLWGGLSAGLLVLVAGALLVPGLSTRDALAATVVGSVIGSALLAVGAYIGTSVGVPTMVLARAALGIRGSYLPTALNVLQLLGWASFEVFVMSQLAATVVRSATGLESYVAWATLFTAIATFMAVRGPVFVVRQWLERFAIWVLVAVSLYLAYYLATSYDVGAILAEAGTGQLAFWAGVDLVIALPVSWFPLVADYGRFARAPRGSFWGTFVGYAIGNAVFFALGLLLVRAIGGGPFELTGALVAALMALALGWVALLMILVYELDQAFANVYSTAVSLQNVLARIPQHILALAVGAVVLALAVLVSLAEYEIFLFLIGAFFVPLLGVVAADFFVVRRGRYDAGELYRPRGRYWYSGGVNVAAVVVWLAGFVVYQWVSPTPVPGWADAYGAPFRAAGLPFPLAADVGASIPSFAVAFVAYAVVGSAVARRRLSAEAAPRRP